ncbi:hypothetical protein ACFV7Q_34625 [Streptomyces sp. NPDC059851]|uniref:hypothetical protein n=1 Tax=Streptomyces sp. NPDC059851 TaxID=3346971 RepID=UPI003662199E
MGGAVRHGAAGAARGHGEEIAVDNVAERAAVKLGVRVRNPKTRWDGLTAEQLAALRELGMEWA